MTPRDGRGRAVSVSERVYRTLASVYPKELRRRYGEEMARYFGDLCQEELRGRGRKGLAALWARTLPELIFTALKERSVMLARNAYLPVPPTAATKWGAISALVGGALGTAFYLLGELVDAVPPALIFATAVLLSALGLVGLYGKLASRSGHPGKLAGAGAVLAVLSVVSWLVVGGTKAPESWSWCRLTPLFSTGWPSGSTKSPRWACSAGSSVSYYWGYDFQDGAAGALARLAVSDVALTMVSFIVRVRFGASVAKAREKELLEAIRHHGEITAAGAALETSLSVEEADRMLSGLAARG